MPQQDGSLIASILPLIVLFAIFYFLVIRPQQKQAKEHKNMLANLQKGDKIITNGGLIAEIVKPEEEFLKIKLDDNIVVKLSREFVAKKIENENKAS
jgi:preprotein translocase subunit YajC